MKRVLIGVVKNQRDLNFILEEKWYRIPVKYAPTKEYDIIAFYQPENFGDHGKRIEYYGVIDSYEIMKREELINDGIRSHERYFKINFSNVIKLKRPIINNTSMRVSFKFCDFKDLEDSEDLAELFGVEDIEGIIEEKLKEIGIIYEREYFIKMDNGKTYRLDFALFPESKKVDLECDNEKYHSISSQKIIDKKRDFQMKKMGWKILRLKGSDIINDIDGCVKKIREILV